MPENFFCSSSCFLYLAAASGFCFSRISLKLRLTAGVSAPLTATGTSNGVCIWGVCTIIPHSAGNPSATTSICGPGAGLWPVSDGVAEPCLGKRTQTQQATVAGSTSQVLTLITGPCQLQRRAKLHSAADNFAFLQPNHRRHDLNFCLRTRSPADQLLKCFVIFRPAIGVSRAVFGDSSNVDGTRPGSFRPTDRHAQKVRVAEGDISHRNRATTGPRRAQIIFRNGNVLVRQRGSADGPEIIQPDREFFADTIEFSDLGKGTELSRLDALTVAGMEQSY